MTFWHGFMIITVVHLLAAASPGPDFIFVTRQSLLFGRRAGLLASLGIALGLSIHIAYSAAGLVTVVAHSAKWMMMIRVGGGSYLIYLGVKGLLSGKSSQTFAPQAKLTSTTSASRQIMMGFLCNALNPKAPIYFLALFTIVLSPDMPVFELVVYGIWLMLLQLLWFSFIATAFTHGALRERLLGARHWIDRVFGAALVALGLRVLASHQK